MVNLGLRQKAELLRILAHPTRLAILEELAAGAKCVTDIQDLLEVPQSNVSQHLAALRRERVVDFHEDGNQRCYYVTRPALVEALQRFISGEYPVHVRSAESVKREGKRHVPSCAVSEKSGDGGRSAPARMLREMSDPDIKSAVAERYGQVADTPGKKFNFPVGRAFAESVGYSPQLLDSLPCSMWESFAGAGNPHPYVYAKPGETVLDLGCGAGLDLYLYAMAVGSSGKIYGLDLSEPMLAKASRNMVAAGVYNAEFLHAPADAIPLPDASIDLVTANGIYNLSPDKDSVMGEVARVLRPGGRTVFAEIVLKAPLPEEARRYMDDWFRCIGGALPEDEFLSKLERAGFARPRVHWKGRNARTGHDLSLCAVIEAVRNA